MPITEPALTLEYLMLVLSVIITTLGLITIGGLARGMFKRKSKPSLKKKLIGFPLFVIGIFGIGWASERLQQGLFTYLMQNAATSISGVILALLVAWVLYDWVLWRRN